VIYEWSDPSFKSERQVAQYLELPILGSLPDLNKVSAALDSKPER
jgi:capsular polysaccharide biosynthesis protein